MADLIIQNLDDSLLVQLKRRAWEEGLPLEESLRRHLAASINNHFRYTRSSFTKKTHSVPWEAELAAWREAIPCL